MSGYSSLPIDIRDIRHFYSLAIEDNRSSEKSTIQPSQGNSLRLSPNLKFHSNTTLIFTSVFIPIAQLSFYSTPQKTADHLFTFHSQFITHNTCHYSICRKRFEKGISAKIYYLYASVRLLMYFFPILSLYSQCIWNNL